MSPETLSRIDPQPSRPEPEPSSPPDQPQSPPSLTARELAAALGSLDLEAFIRRMVFDALSEAVPRYWERRARDFDAIPDPLTAAACREHAALLRMVQAEEEQR